MSFTSNRSSILEGLCKSRQLGTSRITEGAKCKREKKSCVDEGRSLDDDEVRSEIEALCKKIARTDKMVKANKSIPGEELMGRIDKQLKPINYDDDEMLDFLTDVMDEYGIEIF